MYITYLYVFEGMNNNNRLCQISGVKLAQWFYLLCRTISQHLQMLYESFSGPWPYWSTSWSHYRKNNSTNNRYNMWRCVGYRLFYFIVCIIISVLWRHYTYIINIVFVYDQQKFIYHRKLRNWLLKIKSKLKLENISLV